MMGARGRARTIGFLLEGVERIGGNPFERLDVYLPRGTKGGKEGDAKGGKEGDPFERLDMYERDARVEEGARRPRRARLRHVPHCEHLRPPAVLADGGEEGAVGGEVEGVHVACVLLEDGERDAEIAIPQTDKRESPLLSGGDQGGALGSGEGDDVLRVACGRARRGVNRKVELG